MFLCVREIVGSLAIVAIVCRLQWEKSFLNTCYIIFLFKKVPGMVSYFLMKT